MSDLNKFADWIVANQDKKGTPEFDTVASAFKELDAQSAPTELAPDFTMGEQFSRGLERGTMRLKSTFGDVLPAMAASAVGADEYAQRQLEEAAQTEEEIARRLAPQYGSYKDIGGIGDFIGYTTETIGEQVPNLLAAVVPGVGGGALAGRAAAGAVTKQAAQRIAEKRLRGAAEKAVLGKAQREGAVAAAAAAPKGQLAGAFLGSYALNAPEVFQNIYQETGDLAPAAGLIAGAVSASLDSILPVQIARGLTGRARAGVVEKILEKTGMPKGVARSATAGLAGGLATEAVTEAAQEGISIAAERFIDENPEALGSEEVNRLIESAIRGGVAGGAFGGVGGGASGVRTSMQERAAVRAEEAKVAAEEQRIAEEETAKQAAQAELDTLVAGEQELQSKQLAEQQKEFEALVAQEEKLKAKELELQQKDFERLSAAEKKKQASDLTALRKEQAAQEKRMARLLAEVEKTPGNFPKGFAATQAAAASKAAAAVAPQLRAQKQAETAKTLEDAQAGVSMMQGIPVTAETTPETQLPSDEKALRAWAKGRGFNPALAIFKANGPLIGKDLSDPAQATVVRTAVDEAAKRYSGKNATAAETFLNTPELQAAPVVEAAPAPAPVETAAPAPVETAPAAQADVIETRSKKGVEKDVAAAEKLVADLDARARTNAETEILQAKRQNERPEEVSEQELAAVTEATKDLFNLPPLLAEFRSLIRQNKSPEAARKLVPAITAAANKVDVEPRALLESAVRASDAQFGQVTNEINQRSRRELAKTIDTEVINRTVRIKPKLGELYAPVYKGKDLNEGAVADLRAGRLNNSLKGIATEASPKLRTVLQKVRSLNLKTRLVIGPVGTNAAGAYNPTTDTITLDPETGLNEHTLLHEVIHAAISKVLANPELKLTKDFTRFYNQVATRLGDAYGAQNIQEFAAELIANEQFQAVLKDIKAPKSQSLFNRIMQSIAEFFGFKKNALDVGTKFVSDLIDISTGVEATPGDQLFLIGGKKINSVVGGINEAMPRFTGDVVEKTKNWFSTLRDTSLKVKAFGLLRLDNINDMFGDKLPALKRILDAVERRLGEQERRIAEANKNFKAFQAIEKKHPEATARMGEMARDVRLAEVDILDPNFKPNKENQAEYNRLSAIHKSLPKEVQGIYRTIREAYDSTFSEYKAFLKSQVSPSLAAKLEQQFTRQVAVTGYVPFLRYGDFWLEYVDAEGETVVRAFENSRERGLEMERLRKQKIASTPYKNLDQIKYNRDQVPPTSFVGQVMADLQAKGAPQAQLDQVYQTYLTLFPANSIVKQFKRSKNKAGMETDMVRAYGDTMVRWSRHLTNAKYMPELNNALSALAEEGKFADDTVQAAVENVQMQQDFLRNPTYSNLVSGTTALSYFSYIAGNISSALINLTSIALMTLPMLGAKFGYDTSSSVLMAAGKTALNDWSTGKYKGLYDTLMEHGQLQHTMAREILEGARGTSNEFTSKKAQIMDLLSVPFAATERYNRATTAIAAYELALQGSAALGVAKMNEADAIQYALKTVKDVNTSGMAATGPRYMQGGAGRIMLTFKSFIWNSAYVVGRAFVQATRDTDPDTRRLARRQLLGFYGMSAAVAGVGGLPFFGAAATMANMLNALMGDDDEPYDTRQWTRDFAGELAFKGPLNYLTNVEIANRSSLANDLVFRDDPQGIAEDGYTMTALKTAAGPAGSILMGVERGFGYMQQGEVVRAVEAAFPSFIRNTLKGTRYFTQGALTMKGDPIDEDINLFNSVMQVFGFAPADLSSTYEQRSAAKNFERKVLERKQRILDRWEIASQDGNPKFKAEVRREFNEYRKRYPQLVDARTLDRSLKARKAAEKEIMLGLRWNRNLQPQLEEQFFSGLR